MAAGLLTNRLVCRHAQSDQWRLSGENAELSPVKGVGSRTSVISVMRPIAKSMRPAHETVAMNAAYRVIAIPQATLIIERVGIPPLPYRGQCGGVKSGIPLAGQSQLASNFEGGAWRLHPGSVL